MQLIIVACLAKISPRSDSASRVILIADRCSEWVDHIGLSLHDSLPEKLEKIPLGLGKYLRGLQHLLEQIKTSLSSPDHRQAKMAHLENLPHPAFPIKSGLTIGDVIEAHSSLVKHIQHSSQFSRAVELCRRPTRKQMLIDGKWVEVNPFTREGRGKSGEGILLFETNDRTSVPTDGKACAIDLLRYDQDWTDLLAVFRTRTGKDIGKIMVEHEGNVSRLMIQW
jgi:hypothetical protein